MKIHTLFGGRISTHTLAITGVSLATIDIQPAFAGHWALTGTPTGGYTFTNGGGGGSTLTPSYTVNSVLVDIGAGGGGSNASINGNIYYTGTITWVPTGSLTQDPAPATATLTEYGYATVYTGLGGPMQTAADDGLGDTPITTVNTSRGITQTTTAGSKTASHVTTVAVPAGGSYSFTRHLSNYGWVAGGYWGGELYYNAVVN